MEDGLLWLLKLSLLESTNHKVMELVMAQEDYQQFLVAPENIYLLPPFLHFPELEVFLCEQRQAIVEHLFAKGVESFRLPQMKGKEPLPQEPVPQDDRIVALLCFCYRRIREQVLASHVVKVIQAKDSELRKKWRICLREEERRQKTDFRPPWGAGLTRHEIWLFTYWTDPRLPLCVLSLPDLEMAARLSPELFEAGLGGKKALNGGATEDSLRHIVKRAGLKRFQHRVAKKVRADRGVWPYFGFDSDFSRMGS